MKKTIVVFGFFLFVLTACGLRKAAPTATLPPSETQPPSATASFTPSPTMTETPTQTPTETETPTPSMTPTETNTPTPELTARLIWPRAMFGPGDVTWRDYSCPLEGQKLSCEFEYRKDGNNCYVGATCYDACGWFYSVNTIPPGVDEFSGPCY